MANDLTTEEKQKNSPVTEDTDLFESEDSVTGVNEEMLREMIGVGLWYGRRKTKTQPKMKPYILTNRSGVEIIDVAKTVGFMEKATGFLKDIFAKKGTILFVATQPAAKAAVEELAKKYKMPYVTNRWLGGTLTNFATLSKRVDYFKKLKTDRAAGTLQKYTKKEQTHFGKEIERLDTLFSGVEDMTKLPDVVFVVNPVMHDIVVREANKMKIPVVALVSTDADPDKITYIIPGNDSAPLSVNWVLAKVDATMRDASTMNAAVGIEPAVKA